MVILLSFMIPMQLKFGQEKARLMSLIPMLVFFALVAAIAKLKEVFGNLWDFGWMSGIPWEAWALVGVGAVLVVLAISVLLSVRIVERKQF